ncbi:MAG: hypothetical protein OIF55_03125 [Amphritea sp.]|nr:hypothetical protein [Amphritea sp.]
MIIIGYYTTDKVYQEAYELLAASLDRVGHKYDFLAIPPADWKSVTDLKPKIVRDALEKYQEPVLYIDVDAFVHKNLNQFFDSHNIDVAVNYLVKKDGSEELLSGTIFFDFNERVLNLVDLWLDVSERNPDFNDQKALQCAIADAEAKINVKRLSEGFTYIFDREYGENVKPIIEHLQASREFYCAKRVNSFKNRIKKAIGLSVNKSEMLSRRHLRIDELKAIVSK